MSRLPDPWGRYLPPHEESRNGVTDVTEEQEPESQPLDPSPRTDRERCPILEEEAPPADAKALTDRREPVTSVTPLPACPDCGKEMPPGRVRCGPCFHRALMAERIAKAEATK